jgi:hypothetical protein
MKTGETGPDRFLWFSVNRSVTFKISKILKKKSKKIRVYFKIFGQNRIKKIELTRYAKFAKVQNVKLDQFWWKMSGFLLCPSRPFLNASFLCCKGALRLMREDNHPWIKKPLENMPIFVKIGRSHLKFSKFWNKILKKLECISRFLVKTEFKKSN